MRCPNCNRFVPFGDVEVSLEDELFDDESMSIEVRVVRPCGICGEELRERSLEESFSLDGADPGQDLSGDVSVDEFDKEISVTYIVEYRTVEGETRQHEHIHTFDKREMEDLV